MMDDLDRVKQALRWSEGLDRYGSDLVLATARLIESGVLTVETLIANGGWTRSVVAHSRHGRVCIDVYFTYRRPGSTSVEERVYLDASTWAAWDSRGRDLA